MIEPEIAFADLSDDATLAERSWLLETLSRRNGGTSAFFDERVERAGGKLQGIVSSGSCAGLQRGDPGAQPGRSSVPGE
jgi:hypothetical protein